VTANRLAVIVLAGLACCGVIRAQLGANLEVILEERFEGAEEGALPEGWSVDYGEPENLAVTARQAHEGRRSLYLRDPDEETATGLRSPKVAVEPDEVYYVMGWWLGEPGNGASLYLEFWDEQGTRIKDAVDSFAAPGTGQWCRYTGASVAPENAVAATVLLYSWSGAVGEGYFDDVVLGKGVPVLYDRTPRPPADVHHPVGLYKAGDIERAKRNIERHEWARTALANIINGAQWWMDLPDEEIAEWIPEGTPFRVCDCPACGAHWGVSPWRFLADGRVQCRRCETIFPNEDYPQSGVEEHINPLGEREQISYYEDDEGKRYRLEGLQRYGRITKLGSLGNLGRAYALTGDVAYAEKIRRVLLRLAEVYPAYIAHDWYRIYRDYNNLQSGKMSGWKLHDASTLIELCLAYDLTVESGVYSDEDRSIIEEGVFREGGRLLTTTSPRGCCVNDGPFLMAAGGYIGRLLAEHDYVAWAIEPPHGFFGFIEENFWRDGHWEDGSPSYEGMALSKFYVLPEIMHGYSDPPSYDGADRYDDLDMLSHPLMRKVLVAGEHVTAPDGFSPAINDSTFGARHSARHAEQNYLWFPTRRNLRIMVHACGGDPAAHGTEYALFRRDPDIDFEDVEPLDLATESLVRPGLGWAILRAGEGADRSMVVLDYGPVRGHAHPDKLNYAFWAHGTELVTDLGYLGARHHFQPWLRATAAHNEVLVDGDAQRLAAGELLAFVPGDFAQSIRAAAPRVHEQAELYERTLTLVAPRAGPPYIVDVFQVRGGERNLMAFHGDGETFESPLEFEGFEDRFITEKAENGDWIRSQERAWPAGPFTATWRIEPDNDLGVRLTVLDHAATAYHITAPGLRNRSDTWGDRTLHVLLWEQPGPVTTFVSVAEALQGPPRLGSIERVGTSADSVVGVRIEREGATDYVFVAGEPSEAVSCTEPTGLRFTGREAVVSVGPGGPRFARLVDGTSLELGELSLRCAGPMAGTIAAWDDDADTISTAALLPEGEALRGRQLLVAGRVDGAYEIAFVERGEQGSVVHLADEPIMRVETGDEFAIASVVEALRLDDGTWTLRADCDVDAALPRPEGVNSRVMLRVGDRWRELPHESAGGAVSFRIAAEQLAGAAAVLLLTDGDVDLTDAEPPAVERVRVDGAAHPGGTELDLGFVDDPHLIAFDLADAANAISGSVVEASLVSGAGEIEASLVPSRADPRSARLLVRLRELPRGEHTLCVGFLDRAANRGDATVRFNTRGHVFRATALPVIGDSGKLSKPLGGLNTQFYRSEEVGDYVTYELSVPETGRYQVTFIATGHRSYGTCQVSIDGRCLGEPVDAWRKELDVAGVEVPCGEVDLSAGRHRLRLEIVGRNEASENYYIGWHSIVLRPVAQ